MNVEKKIILVCPLGWGLGHASRDIPIIDSFRRDGHKVIIAGDEQSLALLSNRFEGVKTIHFPSFKVRFSKRQNQVLPLLWIALRLPYHIIKEHLILKRIVRQLKIDVVISDNRYGLWNNDVKTILITHQLKIFFPRPFRFLEPLGTRFIRFMAEKFDSCWIPDYYNSTGLAGELSHPKRLPSNARYIGIISRFQKANTVESEEKWGLVGIVSGPSPHREILISEIEKFSKRQNLKTLIIKGNPNEGTEIVEQNGIWYAGHLEDKDFASVVTSSKYLICRAGYSSIMDLVALGVKCLIVPTPGQTEQEYLAEFLSDKGLFQTCKQSDVEKQSISEYMVDLNSCEFLTTQKLTMSFLMNLQE